MEELVKMLMEQDGLSESEAKDILEYIRSWGSDVEEEFVHYMQFDSLR